MPHRIVSLVDCASYVLCGIVFGREVDHQLNAVGDAHGVEDGEPVFRDEATLTRPRSHQIRAAYERSMSNRLLRPVASKPHFATSHATATSRSRTEFRASPTMYPTSLYSNGRDPHRHSVLRSRPATISGQSHRCTTRFMAHKHLNSKLSATSSRSSTRSNRPPQDSSSGSCADSPC